MVLTWGNLHLFQALLPSPLLVFGLLSLDKGKKTSTLTGTLAICVMIANFFLNHNVITAVSYFWQKHLSR